MKRILIFILPILFITALGLTVFGFFQARFQEEKMLDEIKRKARAVAEGTEISVKRILMENDIRTAARIVDKFQKRERLQGCVIYRNDGSIFSTTERFSDWTDKPYVREVLESGQPRGALEKYKNLPVYSYVIPETDDDGGIIGAFELIYDTSYIFNQLADLWKRLSILLVILITCIIVIFLLIQRQMIIAPIQQLTEWFRHFQKGEIDNMPPIKDKGELKKLAEEVEQVALDLRVARKAVTESSQERIKKEDFWTETKLRDTVLAKLGENAFFVVSNREPYMHVINENTDSPVCSRPASGVVTALDPILKACGGTWIAHGSGKADRKFVNSKNKLGVPPENNRYILKRVWLTKEEEQGYYYGFSNEGLWPLCHNTYTRPIFRENDWNMYKKVNMKFAENILEELPANNAFIFIQDYHFALLPRIIKEKRPDVKIAIFWHIPWPNPEIFAICPFQQEILDGMLGADIIGFHIQYHCNNFLDTVNRLIESRVDSEKFSVVRAGKETLVRPYPISVDFNIDYNHNTEDKIKEIKADFELYGKCVALGVDRIDYTKGILERMLAVDRFLAKNPEYKKEFVFIQIAAPSRSHIKKYHDFAGEIDELVEKINWEHADGDWRPIVYLKRHFSPEEIFPFYKLADICIVSSLHDGMNLVAKEYIAAKTDLKGALILSKFTGAARELNGAVQINPYSVEEFADCIKMTVEMPNEEKRKRMEEMRKNAEENNIYKWAGSIVTELTALK